MDIFAEYRAEPEQIIDAGDQVVAVVRVGGPGRRSGAKAMARVGQVGTVKDGKVIRFTEFKEVDDALEAVGLEE
jgi:ketosteroid isomerase-like protein